jgi:hypothetical protein
LDNYRPFLVAFYPSENTTREKILGFFESFSEVKEHKYSHDPNQNRKDLKTLAKRYIDGKSVHVAITIPLTDDGKLSTEFDVQLRILSGTAKEKSYGPEFEREGLTVVHIIPYGGGGAQYFTFLHQVLEAFCHAFEPLYGFGVITQSSVLEGRYLKKNLPERQLWPLNQYDLGSLDEALSLKLRSYWRENVINWNLSIVDGRYALLIHNDERIHNSDLTEDDARSILGRDLDIVERSLPPPTHLKKRKTSQSVQLAPGDRRDATDGSGGSIDG